MESSLKAALREILCASMSLDDGLSTIQNLSIGNTENPQLYYDVARAIEEIILRRPGLASAKLTELTVRLAFSEDHVLRELLMLLDSRYNSANARAECDLIPDIEALPRLLDLLSELIQEMESAIDLNLRPLLPFLTDEILATLEEIYTRGHRASIRLAVFEAHYLTSILSEAGAFDCSEAILNRLMTIAKSSGLHDLAFEVSLDEASILTEIGLYPEAREILISLKQEAETGGDDVKGAAIALQLAINETRDDEVPHETAREVADEAAKWFRNLLDSEGSPKDGLGLAHLVIGTNILTNGWREAVPQGIERLEEALEIVEEIEQPDSTQLILHYKCLTGLGFAHGLMRDHQNISASLDYLDKARVLLLQIDPSCVDTEGDLARLDNAIGWICLSSESDEFWPIGRKAFEEAVERREKLCKMGQASDLELLASQIGKALLQLRKPGQQRESAFDEIQEILVHYVPSFPTDTRAFNEIAIAAYNLVWLSIRHNMDIPPRLIRLLEDIVRMLSDVRSHGDSVFIQGVSLLVPYLNSSWNQLQRRASNLLREGTEIETAAKLVQGLATSRKNLEAVSIDTISEISEFVDDQLRIDDPLLSQYWIGQLQLAKTIKAYYNNKDYSELASGLYNASIELSLVENIETDFQESAEFIRATSSSLSEALMTFALSLENQYAAYIDRSDYRQKVPLLDNDQYDFLLAEDWLGLMKITDSYLRMVEDSELIQAQPHLNAVFSNIARALKMMDSIALIDRRVFTKLGDEMNRRYYLRK
ncbi:MAG: hypothetical protein ACFFEF_04150 [Candidatus Thorarchaeota archaeon]